MVEATEPGTETLSPSILTLDQLETFLRDGVLVVDDILCPEQIGAALRGLQASLQRFDVDTEDLRATGANLQKLSSTNGSGGVLDLIYEDWKLEVATNTKLFQCTTELWRAAFCHKGERKEDLVDETEHFKWHPFGAFDCTRGYVYMDRVGFRLPTTLAETLGHGLLDTRMQTKPRPIQRGLTPHLDCCPETFHAPDKMKWRPIQCMVSLTDTLQKNHGGFEAAKGFHRDFERWMCCRPPSRIMKKSRNGQQEATLTPAPCVGEYTHIRPVEDAEVMRRIQHIPVRAGSAVFWDNRVPHSNAYRHDGYIPRCVVYCSFLPDVEINRVFVAQQLHRWRLGLPPVDTKWMTGNESPMSSSIENLERYLQSLTRHQRCLLGVDPY